MSNREARAVAVVGVAVAALEVGAVDEADRCAVRIPAVGRAVAVLVERPVADLGAGERGAHAVAPAERSEAGLGAGGADADIGAAGFFCSTASTGPKPTANTSAPSPQRTS